MRLERVRAGDWLAGGWGLGLLAVLWLDWYQRPEGGRNAWESFAVTDLLLLLAALACIAVPLVSAARAAPAAPVATAVIATAVTAIVLLVVLARLVFEPGRDADSTLDAGAYLGFLCLVGALLADYLAMRDERMPGIPEPGPFPVMPAPPPPPAR